MEALDNPSYFRLEGDPQEVLSGGPRARDMAPEERKWHRRWSTKSDSAGERVVLGPTSAKFFNQQSDIRRHSSYTSTLPRRTPSVAGKKSTGMLDITIVSSKDSEAAHLWVNYLASCFQQISKDEHKAPFKLARVNAEDVLMGMSVEGSCGSRLQIVIVCPLFLDAIASSPGAPILASMLQPASVLAMLLGVGQQTLESHHLSNLFRFEQWRKQTVKDQDATFVGDFLGIAMDILSRTWQMQQAIAQMNRVENNRAGFSVTPKKVKVGQNKLIVLLNDPVSAHDKITITIDKNGTSIDVPAIKRRNPYTLQFSMPNSCLQTSIIVAVTVERNGRSLGHKLVKCESKLRELDQLLRSTDNPLVFMCQWGTLRVPMFRGLDGHSQLSPDKTVDPPKQLCPFDQERGPADDSFPFAKFSQSLGIFRAQWRFNSLGITNGDKDQLDNLLVAAFKKNMPPNFNLLNSHPVKHQQCKEEYPTLLHFAAKYGLEKLCWQLIESPGGEYACQMQNCEQHNPADIAQHAGHTKLANALHGYLKIWHQMTELTNMYTYLKEATEKPQVKGTDAGTDFGEGNYLLPRPINDTYLIPPKARPVIPTSLSLQGYSSPTGHKDFFGAEHPPCSSKDSPGFALPPNSIKEAFQIPRSPTEKCQTPISPKEYKEFFGPASPLENYQSPPHARPFTPMTPSTPSSPMDHAPKFSAAYLQMHSPVSDSGSNGSHFEHILGPEKKYSSAHPSTENLSIASSGGHHYMNTSCSGSTCSKSPQDELLEIINDFKNNVFTIAEVEKLVENWRNRNDVQQSFREKQEQLNQMRHEYEKIQQQMKDQLKRATPFDRIKKFFSRKHKHEGCPKSKNAEAVCNRPVSSLSLHSSCSSSSGRMSTASGTSLGDSGTHSDPDEKKSDIAAAEKSSPTHSHGPDFTFHDVRLQSVQENEVINCSHDEYVNPTRIPLALPPKKFGYSAPSLVERTVVEVHRSDIICEKEVASCKQASFEEGVSCEEVLNHVNTTEKTPESTGPEVKTTELVDFIDSAEAVPSMDSIIGSEEIVNTEVSDSAACPISAEEPDPTKLLKAAPKTATLAKMESDDDELYILEHSEKLLKDIAEALPTYDQDDILSPTESAFTENGTFVEETKEETPDLSELETKDLFDDSVINEALTKEVDDKDDSSNEEEPLLKDSQSSSPQNDRFDMYYANVDHTAIAKDYVGLPDCASSPESPLIRQEAEFCKAHEYMNIGVPMTPEALREYVNVSAFPTPPLPPKFKYKNVIL